MNVWPPDARQTPLVSAVPFRLRRFVAIDSDLLIDVLTSIATLQLLADRRTLTAPPGTGIGFDAAPVEHLVRLYRSGNATDTRVLRAAASFERADRRT